MLVNTTSTLGGRSVENYLGPVGGEAILWAYAFRNFCAGIHDKFGGRSARCKKDFFVVRGTRLSRT